MFIFIIAYDIFLKTFLMGKLETYLLQIFVKKCWATDNNKNSECLQKLHNFNIKIGIVQIQATFDRHRFYGFCGSYEFLLSVFSNSNSSSNSIQNSMSLRHTATNVDIQCKLTLHTLSQIIHTVTQTIHTNTIKT